MKMDELEGRMRSFEDAHDPTAPPGVWLVARLDGRSFTRLTKQTHRFEAPFDPLFHDYMMNTVEHLMVRGGLGVVFGFTQSDEISLLFGANERGFGRKIRKLLSILAGEASARFSLLLGSIAVFDCRVSQLPSHEHVVDYFRWRSEDARRNARNAHCYWLLRKQGQDPGEATETMRGLTVREKNELLLRGGVDFNDLPAWQTRGSGLYWEEFERFGENPLTGERRASRRRRLRRDLDLPRGDDYSAFLSGLMDQI